MVGVSVIVGVRDAVGIGLKTVVAVGGGVELAGSRARMVRVAATDVARTFGGGSDAVRLHPVSAITDVIRVRKAVRRLIECMLICSSEFCQANGLDVTSRDRSKSSPAYNGFCSGPITA